ncbi:Exosome complex exonuclease RRP45, putative [Perkinsus marinus ATCC 50983]|uniref:Exosome complex exonuclease RRP45, putative n=1 Tax=Perkinsus marinus (strain ATCC 50983 / TXsc) TaxID=423536 RepID=C5LV80_PERM5|nr:Exosome complex exonuclease RRP45, putative [Perkinsus marinus ATCC 50983]EEQ99318.1 Exosome complex exonuclease RRP45, putative [Perkinsus marinus ATCC 50983]|eukprot:XP_002766601.1 Exosome complex exonuclease RRP45, putative [Perkinsus marinus ATCC 50983]
MSLALSDEIFLSQNLFHTGTRPALGQAECSIGKTRIRAVVTGQLTSPPSNRPREGRLSINVEAGPMAAPAVLPSGNSSGLVGSAQTPEGISLCNQLERMLKGSNAVDVEALCIQSGSLVWELRLDVHVLSDNGNVGDAAAIASTVALRHYRRAEVSVVNGEIIYKPDLDPIPLSVHHMPIPVTFASIPSSLGENPLLLADPSSLEESLQGDGGQLVVVMNQYGELCGALKSGGASLMLHRDLMPAIRLATARVKEVTALIDEKLAIDEHTRFDVHKADIHHKYASSGLAVDFDNDISPQERQHRRKRSLAHLAKPLLKIPQPMELDLPTEHRATTDSRPAGDSGEEEPSLEPSAPTPPDVPTATMYSTQQSDGGAPDVAGATTPAPTLSVAAPDDDDLDDLSAAVLVKKAKKKRRPRK